MNEDWFKELSAGVTICDRSGVIVYMNEGSAKVFEEYGGFALMGKNLLDCHPEKAREQLQDLLNEPKTNCYTIEKNGKHKMIYQAPVFENGIFTGLVELALPIQAEVPHYIRKNS